MGGESYIVALAMNHVASYAFQNDKLLLFDDYKKRELKKMAENILQDVSNNNIQETIAQIEDQFYGIIYSHEAITHEAQEQVIESVTEGILRPKEGRIITTGYPGLDNAIGGLRPQELIIIGGRPGMGKTALALSLAHKIDKAGTPSLFFSIDMGRDQFYHRIFSMYTAIPVSRFGDMDEWTEAEAKEIAQAASEIKRSQMMVVTDPYVTINDIRAKTRIYKERRGVKVVFVDHLGKLQHAKATSREREVGQSIEALKAISKELDVCIIALSQLNRDLEKRDSPRPKLSDFRDTGAIEQEADIIIMPYRAEYYGYTANEYGQTAHGSIEAIIGKNRNSRTGTVQLHYDAKRTMVTDPSWKILPPQEPLNL